MTSQESSQPSISYETVFFFQEINKIKAKGKMLRLFSLQLVTRKLAKFSPDLCRRVTELLKIQQIAQRSEPLACRDT